MKELQQLKARPLIAHRGACAFAPENTLSAFYAAKLLGLSWVEFDVTLSASEDVVVIHDATLERTTNGWGEVIEKPYTYLKTLDAGSWFHACFAYENIPTLEAVLVFLSQQGLCANIELKASSHHETLLVNKVLTLLKKYSLPYFISSFSHPMLVQVKKMSAHTPCAFLMDTWQEDWAELCAVIDAVAINVNASILTQARVQLLKSSRKAVLAYTVDEKDCAHRLLGWGVDGVFSNCPRHILQTFQIQWPQDLIPRIVTFMQNYHCHAHLN